MCDIARVVGKQVAVSMLAVTLCAATSAVAREHGAHVHGAGQLNIATDGNKLEIELIVPGADIVGFEHAAASTAEKQAVTTAEKNLSAGDSFFSFPVEASCRFETAKVALETAEESEHEHEHESQDSDHHGHTEFHVQYHFVCGRMERLSHIDVSLFQRFPAMHELAAQWTLARGQGATKLTPTSARLGL